ncbi:Nuclear envelope integral membrane protein 2 [Bienertia sinuspersici]
MGGDGAGVWVARGGECGGGAGVWVARGGEGGGWWWIAGERRERRRKREVEHDVDCGDFSVYRIVFLVLGTLLITLAPTLSESLVFYYSSAMVVGIILVVLVVLFQGMKLLPTGRGNSLAFLLYSSFSLSDFNCRFYSIQIGVGSFFLSYLPRLLHTMLTEMGVSEDMYNPVCKFYVIDSEDCLAIFFFLFISLAGAWLGFWVVRRLILTEEGLIDTSVAQFVAWSIRILGTAMVLQCSLDPLLAAEALISAAFISSILRRVARPRLLRRLYR